MFDFTSGHLAELGCDTGLVSEAELGQDPPVIRHLQDLTAAGQHQLQPHGSRAGLQAAVDGPPQGRQRLMVVAVEVNVLQLAASVWAADSHQDLSAPR